MIGFMKKALSLLLSAVLVISVLAFVPGIGSVRSSAASWNGTNYGGGTVYGYRSFLEAYGIDYDVYMKWLDDHDADSPNPDYYLGTPYVGDDHRNPNGDCKGAYGEFDTPGVGAMNCTGFVWHVLYKAAVNSGASYEQISRLKVMGGVLSSWANYGVYRIYFKSLEDAYNSRVLEKGDVMWIYGSSDNHNAIFYGDSPTDWIYWDSAGERNRYCEIHAIGDCLGVLVAKASQPDDIELHINTRYGDKTCFGAKYSIFTSRSEAQAAIDNPDNDAIWDKRIGTIALNKNGHGCLRTQSAPSKAELWRNGVPQYSLNYFNSSAQRVSGRNTYYAVQWSACDGIIEDSMVHELTDSGEKTSSGYRIFSFNAPKKVDTPQIKKVKSTYDGVKISWEPVKGAERYRVYYKNAKGSWTRFAETASSSCVDKDVRSGGNYTYTVRCVDREGSFTSFYDTSGKSVKYKVLDTPKLSSGKSEADGIRLKWGAVDGAERYRVYFKNSKGAWVRVTETSESEYLDGIVTAGNSYTYTLRCVDSDGDFTSGYYNKGWKKTYDGIDTPKIKEITSEPNGLKLSWDAVEGASKYRIYCKGASGDWANIAETDSTEYFDGVVTAGNSYTYTIRCLNSSGSLSSGYEPDGMTQKYIGIATPVITETSNEEGGVRIKWDEVENAYKYRVYYKNRSGGWTKMAETGGTEFLDTDVSPEWTYTYTVRCVNAQGGFTSDFDRVGVKHTFKLSTPKITGAENVESGIKLTWNKPAGVYGYRVFYLGSDGWNRLGVSTTNSFIDTDVRSGNTYTYTIRCIDKNGNYISDYDKEGFKATFIATPVIRSADITIDGVKLSWDTVKGAYGYRVFYLGSDGWKRLTTTTSSSVTDTDVRSGGTYTYTVRCIDENDNYISDYDGSGIKATFISTPKVNKLYSNNNGVVLNWDAVNGAYSYRIFRRGSDGWERLGLTTGTSFTDKTAENGKTYTYTVRCMDKKENYISDYYSGFTTKCIRYIDVQATAEDEGVKLSWTPIDEIASYKIFRQDGNGNWKTIAVVTGAEWIDTKVESGKTYTYTLRGLNSEESSITGYDTTGKSVTYLKTA